MNRKMAKTPSHVYFVLGLCYYTLNVLNVCGGRGEGGRIVAMMGPLIVMCFCVAFVAFSQYNKRTNTILGSASSYRQMLHRSQAILQIAKARQGPRDPLLCRRCLINLICDPSATTEINLTLQQMDTYMIMQDNEIEESDVSL